MIFTSIIDPSIIEKEIFNKNYANFESLRLRFENNLIIIFDKEGKIKSDFAKKLNELKNPPTLDTAKFVNTFLDFIVKYKKKHFNSNFIYKDNIFKFSSQVRKELKFLDGIISTEKYLDTLDPKIEFVDITNFSRSNLYLKLISCDKGAQKSLNKMTDVEFDEILLKLFWNTDYIHFYDDTVAKSINLNTLEWITDQFLQHRIKSLEYIQTFLINNNLNVKPINIKVFTSIHSRFDKNKNLIIKKIKECFPKKINNINFQIKLKLREKGPYFSHKRYIDINSCLIDAEYGTDFLDSHGKRKNMEWKFSDSYGKIDEFKKLPE